MKKILVTGAGGSAAHNFIESLRISAEKYYIVGTDISPYHIELSDVNKKYVIPPVNNSNYLKILNKIIKLENIDFVHPQPDTEVSFLSRNRERVKAKLFLPDKKTIELCQNKMNLLDVLYKANIPTGQSYLIKDAKSLRKSINLLLKNNTKIWIRAIRGAGSKASLPIINFDQAKFWISYWKSMKNLNWDDFMLTEFLPGKEFAFQSLWKNGKLITSQVRERVEYLYGNLTPSGQTSTPSVARTVAREDVNLTATKAVLAADPNATGIFCVDLKTNKDGVACVTEINAGRFFTTSNFFAHAGSNMPEIYVKMAFGEKLPDHPIYNPLPENLYWVRMVDMGYKLVKNNEWESINLVK